jgi:hypothetical protein
MLAIECPVNNSFLKINIVDIYGLKHEGGVAAQQPGLGPGNLNAPSNYRLPHRNFFVSPITLGREGGSFAAGDIAPQ